MSEAADKTNLVCSIQRNASNAGQLSETTGQIEQNGNASETADGSASASVDARRSDDRRQSAESAHGDGAAIPVFGQ